MASDSSSQTQPKQPSGCITSLFQLEDYIIKFNNEVALMESNDDAYKLLLLFLKNSCISVALTKQPSTYYPKYIREFWYTVNLSDECVYCSPKETMMAVLALGLVDDEHPSLHPLISSTRLR
ncbi:hypothetical protein Tco_0087280 [Tanacetum coccineum]